jgi:hypothetical protein
MKGILFLVAAAATLALASPAGAAAGSATYEVAGKQTTIDADAGLGKMTGDLRGQWATTSFELVSFDPYVEGVGTETFTGCLGTRRAPADSNRAAVDQTTADECARWAAAITSRTAPSSPSRSRSTGSGCPFTIPSKNALRSW